MSLILVSISSNCKLFLSFQNESILKPSQQLDEILVNNIFKDSDLMDTNESSNSAFMDVDFPQQQQNVANSKNAEPSQARGSDLSSDLSKVQNKGEVMLEIIINLFVIFFLKY